MKFFATIFLSCSPISLSLQLKSAVDTESLPLHVAKFMGHSDSKIPEYLNLRSCSKFFHHGYDIKLDADWRAKQFDLMLNTAISVDMFPRNPNREKNAVTTDRTTEVQEDRFAYNDRIVWHEILRSRNEDFGILNRITLDTDRLQIKLFVKSLSNIDPEHYYTEESGGSSDSDDRVRKCPYNMRSKIGAEIMVQTVIRESTNSNRRSVRDKWRWDFRQQCWILIEAGEIEDPSLYQLPEGTPEYFVPIMTVPAFVFSSYVYETLAESVNDLNWQCGLFGSLQDGVMYGLFELNQQFFDLALLF